MRATCLHTKHYTILLFLLVVETTIAQQKQVNFNEIDQRVKSIEPAPPAELAYTLTKDYSSDKEKLRAIFSWITEHITYRVKKNYNKIAVNNYNSLPVFADTAKWKSANDMVAETVLRNRSAVCDGYARLFKTLCDYTGLKSAIITGFAKGDLSRQMKFNCNHTWNAVYLDSAWRLLDVTWASGYTSYSGDEFYKRYDGTYFLAAPEDFIRDHFPDDLRWTLMDNPAIPREFANAPYKNKSFGKYKIKGWLPGGGIIEAAIGDTVQIVLETMDALADSKMASDTLATFDSSLQKINSTIAFLEPAAEDKNRQLLRYSFCVQNSNIEWLHIVYNHDSVLRYRLKIKKEALGQLAAAATKESLPGFFYP